MKSFDVCLHSTPVAEVFASGLTRRSAGVSNILGYGAKISRIPQAFFAGLAATRISANSLRVRLAVCVVLQVRMTVTAVHEAYKTEIMRSSSSHLMA